MSFGDAIQKRIEELRKKGANVPEVLKHAQKVATMHAVETATKMTPPSENTPQRGTGTITGNAKERWDSDSQIEPEVSGDKYTTVLANQTEYISYVNDGHRMDQHFVPGLMVNPHSGLLERVDPSVGGIMVGTKTKYIEGLYMKEAAVEKYQHIVEQELDRELKELFQE